MPLSTLNTYLGGYHQGPQTLAFWNAFHNLFVSGTGFIGYRSAAVMEEPVAVKETVGEVLWAIPSLRNATTDHFLPECSPVHTSKLLFLLFQYFQNLYYFLFAKIDELGLRTIANLLVFIIFYLAIPLALLFFKTKVCNHCYDTRKLQVAFSRALYTCEELYLNYEDLAEYLDELHDTAEQATAQADYLEDYIDELSALLDRLAAHREWDSIEATDTERVLSERLTDLEKELEHSRKTVSTANADAKAASVALKDAESREQDAADKHDKVLEKHAKSQASLNEQLSSTKTELQRVRSELDAARRDASRLSNTVSDLDKLKDIHGQLELDMSTLRGDNERLEAEMGSLRLKLKAEKGNNERLGAENESIRQELKAQNSRVATGTEVKSDNYGSKVKDECPPKGHPEQAVGQCINESSPDEDVKGNHEGDVNVNGPRLELVSSSTSDSKGHSPALPSSELAKAQPSTSHGPTSFLPVPHPKAAKEPAIEPAIEPTTAPSSAKPRDTFFDGVPTGPRNPGPPRRPRQWGPPPTNDNLKASLQHDSPLAGHPALVAANQGLDGRSGPGPQPGPLQDRLPWGENTGNMGSSPTIGRGLGPVFPSRGGRGSGRGQGDSNRGGRPTSRLQEPFDFKAAQNASFKRLQDSIARQKKQE